jgi:DnaJ-class molecular chaperone
VCVQPGTPVGHKLTFADGADQEPGRDTGDLVVVLQEEEDPHSSFRRFGDDLVASFQVSLATALCGDSSRLELLDGQCITIQPPSNYIIKPGTIGRIPGKGMPCFDREGAGTLYLKFQISFPDSLPTRSRQNDEVVSLPSEKVEWTVASTEDLPQLETKEGMRFFSTNEDDVEGCRQQ